MPTAATTAANDAAPGEPDFAGLALAFPHVVALDPPADPRRRALIEHLPGVGWTHLAWGAGFIRGLPKRYPHL